MPTSLRGITKMTVQTVKCEVNHFEEPGAVVPHARICEGAVGQPAVLPRWHVLFFEQAIVFSQKKRKMSIEKVMKIEQWSSMMIINLQKPKLSIYEFISSMITKQTPKSIHEFEELKNFIESKLNDAICRSEEEPVPAVNENGIDSVNFYFFKGDVYNIKNTRHHQQYTPEQIKLLIFEKFDKERKKFEKLMHLYKSDNTQVKPYRRERITERVRIAVWRRDGGKCAHCGSREKLEYDHIVPISKGGSNTERNIELLCERCNRQKSDHIQ